MKFTTKHRHIVLRSKQRGIGIVDAVIWLVIFGAIVGAILGIRNIAFPKAQGWLEASTISTSMQQINSLYTGAPSFAGLNTASVASNAFFSEKYLPGGGTINNRFGGTVTVGVTTITTPNDTQTYTISNVPSNACISLANNLSEDADRITVAGTVVKAINGLIIPTTLTTQCNSSPAVPILLEKVQLH